MANSLYPDQAGHSVGADLGPNCLQRLSADGNIRPRDLVQSLHHLLCLWSEHHPRAAATVKTAQIQE